MVNMSLSENCSLMVGYPIETYHKMGCKYWCETFLLFVSKRFIQIRSWKHMQVFKLHRNYSVANIPSQCQSLTIFWLWKHLCGLENRRLLLLSKFRILYVCGWYFEVFLTITWRLACSMNDFQCHLQIGSIWTIKVREIYSPHVYSIISDDKNRINNMIRKGWISSPFTQRRCIIAEAAFR